MTQPQSGSGSAQPNDISEPLLQPSISSDNTGDAEHKMDNVIPLNPTNPLVNIMHELQQINQLMSVCSALILSMQLETKESLASTASSSATTTSPSTATDDTTISNDESLLSMLASTHDAACTRATRLHTQCQTLANSQISLSSSPSTTTTRVTTRLRRSNRSINGENDNNINSSVMRRYGLVADRDEQHLPHSPLPTPHWTRLAILLLLLAAMIYYLNSQTT